jgi:NitT/TauT family transport system ATP-binding protein
MQTAVIRIDGLGKSFVTEKGDAVPALETVTLEVPSNELLCIVGPSGCGKSTLLRIVAGLEKAATGSVVFHDREVTRPDRRIGMVFQEYSLLPWRLVIDNVALGLEFAGTPAKRSREIAMELLELVNLAKFAKSYPYELSGGMQQRVAIARALANDPEVLLMDEPFGALDAHTRILLQRELLRIRRRRRKTILFVTHSVDEAIYLADRIVVMSARPGRIKRIMEVDIPHPRDRANPAWGKMASEILKMLEEEVELGRV